MRSSERELLINKIISGSTLCFFKEKPVLVYEASPIDKVKAQAIYEKELIKAKFNGNISEEELLKQLQKRNLWNMVLQAELDGIPKKIDALKIELYEAYFHFRRRDNIKLNLESLRKRELELLAQREKFMNVTCEAYAISCKNKYLICSATKDEHDNFIFPGGNIDEHLQSDIDEFIQSYFDNKVDESVLRYLARQEPFRNIWNTGKVEGSVFGKPSSLLTQEQRLLVSWAKLYDNVYESPECPPDEVIEDDDCLDGWLAIQHDKREKERKNQHGYGANGKYNKSDEVFIMVDNPDDAARVEAMNSPQAIFRKQQRMNAMNRAGGQIEEQYMPDSQSKMREQLMDMQRKRMQR